jgi:hypothetical protein
MSMTKQARALCGHAFLALAAAAFAAPALAQSDLPPEALSTKPDGRYYTGYYPSWSDNWFDATGKTPGQVYAVSKFARIPATYTHVNASFANPNFSWGGLAANSWSGTGIDFTATPKDIKAAIDVLHLRKMKVILAVGGATYNDWSPLAAEGAAGSGPRITALANIMKDLGFDGLDVDYEADADITRYANSTRALRKAVDLAGGGRILAVAGWSTGADCIAATSNIPDCAGKLSYWGGNAGRERLLVRDHPDVAKMFDVVNVMSYDARYEHYDGVMAYKQYRKLFGKNTVVSIGFEPAPEGWAGGILVVNNADAQCTGSRILQDQYGKNLDSPYSVARFNMAVKKSKSPNKNPHDGAMIWSILKTASGSCGSAQIASPGTVGKKSATMLGLVNDPLLNDAPWK